MVNKVHKAPMVPNTTFFFTMLEVYPTFTLTMITAKVNVRWMCFVAFFGKATHWFLELDHPCTHDRQRRSFVVHREARVQDESFASFSVVKYRLHGLILPSKNSSRDLGWAWEHQVCVVGINIS